MQKSSVSLQVQRTTGKGVQQEAGPKNKCGDAEIIKWDSEEQAGRITSSYTTLFQGPQWRPPGMTMFVVNLLEEGEPSPFYPREAKPRRTDVNGYAGLQSACSFSLTADTLERLDMQRAQLKAS